MIQPIPASVNLCRPVRYDPYGIQPGRSASLLAFNGEPQDRPTRSYLLGNGRRAYSPALRRFLSADSQSPFSKGGINAYSYCLGDPVNRQDPSGAFSILSLLKRTLWLGSRLKAVWSGPGKLKVVAEAAKWMASVGGTMAFYGIPGGKQLVTGASLVKVGIKAFSVGKSLKKQVEKRAGLLLMDLADAEFSPFVGPVTRELSPASRSGKQIRAA